MSIDTSPVQGNFSCHAIMMRYRLVRQTKIKMERRGKQRDNHTSDSGQRAVVKD